MVGRVERSTNAPASRAVATACWALTTEGSKGRGYPVAVYYTIKAVPWAAKLARFSQNGSIFRV